MEEDDRVVSRRGANVAAYRRLARVGGASEESHRDPVRRLAAEGHRPASRNVAREPDRSRRVVPDVESSGLPVEDEVVPQPVRLTSPVAHAPLCKLDAAGAERQVVAVRNADRRIRHGSRVDDAERPAVRREHVALGRQRIPVGGPEHRARRDGVRARGKRPAYRRGICKDEALGRGIVEQNVAHVDRHGSRRVLDQHLGVSEDDPLEALDRGRAVRGVRASAPAERVGVSLQLRAVDREAAAGTIDGGVQREVGTIARRARQLDRATRPENEVHAVVGVAPMHGCIVRRVGRSGNVKLVRLAVVDVDLRHRIRRHRARSRQGEHREDNDSRYE